MTILNFADHSANERTFLAWVRSAIAVTAFGFLVERFDLFLAVVVPHDAPGALAAPHGPLGHFAGLALILAGMAMLAGSAYRFVRTARQIDAKEIYPGTGSRVDLVLAAILLLLCSGLLLYLTHALDGLS